MSHPLGYEQLRAENTYFLMSSISAEIESAPLARRKILEDDFTKIMVLDLLGNSLEANDPYAIELERRRQHLLFRRDKQRYIDEMTAATEIIAPHLI